MDEIRNFEAQDRVFVDSTCGIITIDHIEKDNAEYPKTRLVLQEQEQGQRIQMK